MKTLISIIIFAISMPAMAREFTQTGDSMSPTIEHGESIEVGIISSFFYEPKRWEIVLFANPTGDFNAMVGRIVGMPNEVIFIDKDGLHINGSLIKLPKELRTANIRYIPPDKTMAGNRQKNKKYRTRDNEYFILGDNSYTAYDSRFFGAVHRNDISNKIESLKSQH